MFGNVRAMEPLHRVGEPSPPTPYGSAQDLPSFRELQEQLRGLKLLTRLVARDQRQNLKQLERDVARLVRVVDDFYALLGPRNWIFHDSLSVDRIDAILQEATDADEAEMRFIDLYRDPEAFKWWIVRLHRHEGLRARSHQIDRARAHYEADQFDSCVLQLIAVMDGFVNDFEPAVRQGLSARQADEMTAWDSVVGHHMGLTNALNAFTRTVKKRMDDEIFEVHRHGIMHGSVVKFDNVIVATKAWNMLFAVADWAAATEKASKPRAPQPTWGTLVPKLRRHAAYRRHRDTFVPETIPASDERFSALAVIRSATDFLNAWQHKRWGLMAPFAPPAVVRSKSAGRAAARTRETFHRYELTAWELLQVRFDQASTAELKAAATVAGDEASMTFRMVRWTKNENLALPDEAATWHLAIWAPHTFFELNTDTSIER